MATIDLGKIKFTWTGAFATGTTYSADDVASHAGSSWVYVNAAAKTGTAAGAPSASNSAHWNLMADGANPLTTSGDLMSHSGSAATRVPIGSAGQILASSGSSVTWAPNEGFTGMSHLLSNYGETNPLPGASTTYGVNGSRPWLADYANGWIPECGTPNPAMGPIKGSIYGHNINGYRFAMWLNQNHEIVSSGNDDYGFIGSSTAEKHNFSVVQNISNEFGGMRKGDYFVRIWVSYMNICCLTKDGDLFMAGYNGYGQNGKGNTLDSLMLTKVPTLGPDCTHGGVSTQIAGFHYATKTDYGSANLTSCYAIDTSGRLFVWGYNASGKLGIGNTTNQSYPVLCTAVSNVVSVSAGHLSAHCIDTSGNLFQTGHNAYGIMQGTATTTWTDSNQDNVWCVENHDGDGLAVDYASVYYLKTNGEMYGIGHNHSGNLGDGTSTNRAAYVRCGGSLTFSEFKIAGNSLYWNMSSKGGTPAVPTQAFYNWGYNPGGQLGRGNTTALFNPTQPLTTSKFTHVNTSTDANTAPTLTDVAVPVNAVKKVWAIGGLVNQGRHFMYLEDNFGRTWKAGHGQNLDYSQNITGDVANTNYFLEPSPWNTTGTLSTGQKYWAGQTETAVHSIWMIGTGVGSSEGSLICATTDGRVWGKGYNSQGQLGVGSQVAWVGQWVQLTP